MMNIMSQHAATCANVLHRAIIPSVQRRRHEKLALDLRTQLGGMDGRLASAEGRIAGQLGAVDALQMQVKAGRPSNPT